MFLHNPELLDVAVSMADEQNGGAAPSSGSNAPTDIRWTDVKRQLDRLHHQHRHAVRILDVDCGCGDLLIAAVRYASAIGFVAIEGKGVERSPAAIAHARTTARQCRDCAIGLEFMVQDAEAALADEADFPPDIVLANSRSETEPLLAAAGACVIASAPIVRTSSDEA